MTLPFAESLPENRRVILFGGKGGVGKTTISSLAALHYAAQRRVILFTTDPASNLADIFDEPVENLTIESLDASKLYARFLDANLPSFLELGDRGTYLDRDELQRFFELSLPGIDELMAWSRIGELAEENEQALIVVDTAPTGHTVRMLFSSEHFAQLGRALDALQEKHRTIARQLTRKNVRDAMDAFIERFDAQSQRRRELLRGGAFIPVMLSEPLVVEQTRRLITEVGRESIEVPFVVLNRAATDCDCSRCREQAVRDDEARKAIANVVDVPRSCTPLDSVKALRDFLTGHPEPAEPRVDVRAQRRSAAKDPQSPGGGEQQSRTRDPEQSREASGQYPSRTKDLPQSQRRPQATIRKQSARLVFFAGKGGVGKTTTSTSYALQAAGARPSERFVIISVDPAHSLRDVFANEAPPPNLTVEAIDTRAKWRDFRDTLGAEIERAVNAITPTGLTVAYDADAMRELIELAPPGADELFAITRLADLAADDAIAQVVVDTAPTGHFLRLLDLPSTAGQWVREFMRILLRYRELIPAGSLGEELIRASRALHALDETLRSERTAVFVVTRPERIVIAETRRLLDELQRRGIPTAAVIANYVTPIDDCRCDREMRGHEEEALRALGREDLVIIERRDRPVSSLDDIASLFDLH